MKKPKPFTNRLIYVKKVEPGEREKEEEQMNGLRNTSKKRKCDDVIADDDNEENGNGEKAAKLDDTCVRRSTRARKADGFMKFRVDATDVLNDLHLQVRKGTCSKKFLQSVI